MQSVLFADTYTMKAFGHKPVTLYKWAPEFSTEDDSGYEAQWHCIFSQFFVNKSFDDAKKAMEEGGFITVNSFRAEDFSTDWSVLRILPYNVEYCETWMRTWKIIIIPMKKS